MVVPYEYLLFHEAKSLRDSHVATTNIERIPSRARSDAGIIKGGERKDLQFEDGKEEIREREGVEYGGGGGEELDSHEEREDTVLVEDAWEVCKVSASSNRSLQLG